MTENELSEDQVRALFDACKPAWETIPDDMVGKVWAGGPRLKPCPFCGSTDVFLVQDRYGSWGVECHGYMCHAYLTNSKWRCERRMDAIALWNKRVKE